MPRSSECEEGTGLVYSVFHCSGDLGKWRRCLSAKRLGDSDAFPLVRGATVRYFSARSLFLLTARLDRPGTSLNIYLSGKIFLEIGLAYHLRIR